MKKLYFGTNLKMYKNIQDTIAYLQELADRTKGISREEMELFVIPSYTSLNSAVSCIDHKYIKLGAQNMCWEMEGQFTGEISPYMLKELNLDMVMIGHSERRHIFRETNLEENQKMLCAIKNNFTALLCIGETLEEKSFGISREILRTQLKTGLHNISDNMIGKIMIAYEPVWAIGVNGIPATVEYAEEMHQIIKECLNELFGSAGNNIPVLYGGSVNPDNANDLIIQPSIDGLFTGRSAWNAKNFTTLIQNALIAYKNQFI